MGLIKNLMGLFIGFNLAQRVTSVFDGGVTKGEAQQVNVTLMMAMIQRIFQKMFFESIGLCCKWPFYPQYVPNRFYSVNQTQPLQFCLG